MSSRAIAEGTAGVYLKIKKLQEQAKEDTRRLRAYKALVEKQHHEMDLNRLTGQIQGIEYVLNSLCSCEIKATGQEWLRKQIDERQTRLKKLQNERTNEP